MLSQLPGQCSASETSMSLSSLSEGDIKVEDCHRVLETLIDTFVPLSQECFDEHVFKLHGDLFEELQASLDKVSKLFKQLFPTANLLNPSLKFYQLLDTKEETEQAFEKADQLYQAYKKECIEEALSKMPLFLYEKHKLDEKDIPIMQKIIPQITEVFKTTILAREFDMLHNLCALRTIHYALGIPSTESKSEIFFVLRAGHSIHQE